MKDSNGDLTYLVSINSTQRLTDHLGSVVAITDDQNNLISQQRYLPFGAVRLIPNSQSLITDFGYTGQRNLDAGIGLMDYRARFYSPVLNRFIQPDSIVPNPVNPQGFNRFSYVVNSPINFNDPSGNVPIDCMESVYCGSAKDPEYVLDSQLKPKPKGGNDDGHKHGEPLCNSDICQGLEDILTLGVITLDAASLIVSGVEAGIANSVYVFAAAGCVVSQFTACGIAFKFALQVDMAVASLGGVVENSLGWFSTALTASTDILVGNTGIDSELGLYIGKDTIVSMRNSLAGSIPESNIDVLVSLSQFMYDIKRLNGEKQGGYVQVFETNTNNKMLPPFTQQFINQFFFKDW